MKSSVSLRLKVSGCRPLTYGVPEVSQLSGHSANCVVKIPRKLKRHCIEVGGHGPGACLLAAGHKVFLDADEDEEVLSPGEIDALLKGVEEKREAERDAQGRTG